MKITLFLTLLFSLAFTAFAQTNTAVKVDEFGNVNCEDELARLDMFFVTLQANQSAQGYIIVYGGSLSKRNQAKASLNRMRVYIVSERKLPASRLVFIDGGFRREGLSTELWTTEKGQAAPPPTPTMNRKEVKFTGTARILNRSCNYGLG